jgi:hypothetical protein
MSSRKRCCLTSMRTTYPSDMVEMPKHFKSDELTLLQVPNVSGPRHFLLLDLFVARIAVICIFACTGNWKLETM